MNHVCTLPNAPNAYAWTQSHGYSLNNSVNWQLVPWWSYAYNAIAYNAMQHGQMVSAWYANAQKEMILKQDEQEAAEGLLVLSSSSLESQSTSAKSQDQTPPNKAKTHLRLASNSIRRSEMHQIFGKRLSLPLKCTVAIEVDGKVRSKRPCEIRGNRTFYMTSYDRTSCNGLYDKGLRLDNIDDKQNVTLVRMFTKHPY